MGKMQDSRLKIPIKLQEIRKRYYFRNNVFECK